MNLDHDELLYERRGGIAIVSLHRPKALNALTNRMIDDIAAIAREVEEDDDLRVLVLTGTGKAFSVGLDLGGAGKRNPRTRFPEAAWRNWTLGHVLQMAKPTIAAINGVAAGGGLSFCLECDIRVASENARFTTAYLRTGMPVLDGVAALLPEVVGTSKALEMLYTSEVIDAAEAKAIGLVSRVTPADQLMDVTMELAERIAAGPPIAQRLSKDIVQAPLRRLYADHLPHQLYAMHVNRLMAAHDLQEGGKAFMEKRPPKFTGLKKRTRE
ncbi:MAG: enoyl-CoA hydratase/isomerase family protein [Chloroflexi bacterium]|nr:enoyl-CoA hydratase/isomerase family protein [Chloroflexota bacterium]